MFEGVPETLAAKREALLADGWTAVEVLETGRSFDSWKYERMGREAFDPARHEVDALLAEHIAAVRWDV